MDDKSARNLALNVKTLRELHRMTQQELAEAAGISVTAVQHIEYGGGGKSRMITIRAIAAALKVTTNELMQDDYRSPTTPDRITKDLLEAIKAQIKEELMEEMKIIKAPRPSLTMIPGVSPVDHQEEVSPQQAKRLIIERLNTVPSIFLPKLYYFFDELVLLIASGKQLKNGDDPDSK